MIDDSSTREILEAERPLYYKGYNPETKVPSVVDPVHLPAHYARFKIEPVYFIGENNLPFWMGNVIKYVCRWDHKDGIQDLKKARRYLDMQIKKLEGDPQWAK